MKLKLNNCFKVYSIDKSALYVANKIAFDKGKGYSTSWDGQTYWDFAHNLDRITFDLSSYEFSPLLELNKRIKWKHRKLYISTWRDKIVETFLHKSLNKLLSNWFSENSYAYRSNKSSINLCQQNIINNIGNYIIKRDIKDYFYSIDHQILLEKLAYIIDTNDRLFTLLRQRIEFNYYNDDCLQQSQIGLPFGSPIACVLANIFLTDLDHKLSKSVNYYRYADDFLIMGNDVQQVLSAAQLLSDEIKKLNLTLHPNKTDNFSFYEQDGFVNINKFKYLGLEHTKSGLVRLPVEKKRKLINIFKRALESVRSKCKKANNIDDKLRLAIDAINVATLKRIRYVAIIDYYIYHITDENQLKTMDLEIAQLVIAFVLNKRFRKKDFKVIPFKKLRDFGLVSLLYKNRLYRDKSIRIPFLSIYNKMLINMHLESVKRRIDRVNQMRMIKKLAKL